MKRFLSIWALLILFLGAEAQEAPYTPYKTKTSAFTGGRFTNHIINNTKTNNQ